MNQPYIDFGYIIMTKQKENDLNVWYQFEVSMETGEYESDKKGRRIMLKKPLFGIFKFTKNTKILNEPDNYGLWTSTLLIEESDPIFSENDKNRIMAKCLVIMGRCLKDGEFSTRLVYAN